MRMFDLRRVVYVQISPQRLTVRNVRSGQTISEVPEAAIGGQPKATLIACGAQARLAAAEQGAKIFNPFAHPRSLVSDFTVGELLVKAFVRRALGQSLIKLAPLIVMHPLGEPEGGFTQIENRVFRELGLGAGAAEVIVWHGATLTDEEILSKKFSANGRIVN
jgi:rod shape-determining protein MreB